MHDLVLRNGTLIDGSGAPARRADVAIDGDKIVAVGDDIGSGYQEIDCTGLHITPGWVDVHTHYDAQITWDPDLSPSGWHGVTTVVMGSCGVGFAPVRPTDHDALIELMEAVEDIPGSAMHEGLSWGWETFPEYMDALESLHRVADFAAQVPHAPLRVYVMGERGTRNELATREEAMTMAAHVRSAIEAGALGFSTTRTLIHRTTTGDVVPGTHAGVHELRAIASGLQQGGGGVFQVVTNHTDALTELKWMEDLSRDFACTVSLSLQQTDEAPDLWREVLTTLTQATERGADLIAQVAGRPTGVLMGWQCTAHPFVVVPAYQELAVLPWAARLEHLRRPDVRARILSQQPPDLGDFYNLITRGFHKMFPLGDPPNYEPHPATSIGALAEREGRSPAELAYDTLMKQDGEAMMYMPLFNYSYGHLDHLVELISHPRTRLGLGDGGAHCGAICDASIPTYLLAYWGRDRPRGTLPVETLVQQLTRDNALFYGLADRGLVAPGYRADLNVVDLAALDIHRPELVYDLPAGGRRLIQTAVGYHWTTVGGQIVLAHGQRTTALPGRLIRGRRVDHM